ncbi:hypothetical protein V6N13_108133 [Hibiscus sabdariffa]
MKCRRRPLHTWGVSAIAVSHKAYMKAQDLNEPIALMAKRLLSLTAHMVSCILHCVQHFWLAIFFFVDECILALENMIETVFPSSKHVFDRVDEAVEIIEALPGKFDDVLVEFPAIIKQVPFLDWGLCLAISWLNLLTSVLTRWGFVNTKEKQAIDGGVSELKVGHNEGKLCTRFLKVGCKPEAKTNQNKAKLPTKSHNVGTDYNEAQLSTESLSIAYIDDEKIQKPGKKFGKMANSSAAKGKYKDQHKGVLLKLGPSRRCLLDQIDSDVLKAPIHRSQQGGMHVVVFQALINKSCSKQAV